MKNESQNDKEKTLYADALRRTTLQYEDLLSDLSAQRLFNDSLQVDMDYSEICHRLVKFLTEATAVEMRPL